MRSRLAALLMLAAVPALAAPPRLTLVIVVDALGTDLYLRSLPGLPGGLKQLSASGAVFPAARYQYSNTVTAAGHATLATGANPWRHGIVSNWVIQRATGKGEAMLPAGGYQLVGTDAPADDGNPEQLMVGTLSDQLKLATSGRGKAVALASKARAAVLMAGKTGAPYWFDDSAHAVTSTYYTQAVPAWLEAYNRRELAAELVKKGWPLLLPRERYAGEDDCTYESDRHGLGRTFPHPLTVQNLGSSPFTNDLLVELAKAALAGEKLGQDDVPDLLWVSFPSVDRVHHLFGPHSWEMQDAMARLDARLTDLVAAAERAAGGRDKLLVVLAGDHGGAAAPEWWKAAGMDGVRVDTEAMAKSLDAALQARFRCKALVAGIGETDVYLSPRAAADCKLDGALVRREAAAQLTAHRDVAFAVARDDLFGPDTGPGYLRALRTGYFPERSGDVLWVLRPFHVYDEQRASSHGSPHAYDADVPLILWGRGVKPGRYYAEAHPTDVAPTLAALLELGQPPSSEGRPLTEAFAPR